jgi:hypothetical protein
MIISHVKIIPFLQKLSLFKDCPLYSKDKNTWKLGNTGLISCVEHDISLVCWCRCRVDVWSM